MTGKEAIKILHVVRDIEGTGGGNIVINTAKIIRKDVGSVVVLTDVSYGGFLHTNIQLAVIPFGSILNKWRTKGKFLRTVRHTLQILNFILFTSLLIPYFKFRGFVVINNNNEALFGDIVSVHNVFSAEVFGHGKGLARGLLRLLNPVMFIRVLKEQLFLRFKSSVLIVANSKETKREILKYIGSNSDIHIISSGVDVNKFNYNPNDFSINKPNRFTLLFVGHEFERKGLAFLIQSLNLLPEEIVLKVVGGRGSSISKYTKMVENEGLQDRVFFLGSQSNLSDIYASSNLFILPSAYEGLPLVCLESMASGLPNLVTFVGGMKDLVVEGENGGGIDRNATDIASKVNSIYTNPEHYKLMRLNARQTALGYSWDNISNQYLNLILETRLNG